jgi:transcriptional regulator with XRE-family HTH domain
LGPTRVNGSIGKTPPSSFFSGIATHPLLPNVPIDCNKMSLDRDFFHQLETVWRSCYRLPVVRGRRNPLHFGLAVRLKRARQNLSFDSVAEAAGLGDGNAVLRIERRRDYHPRLDTVERVAYAIGLSPAFLAYGIEADTSQPTEACAARCGLDFGRLAPIAGCRCLRSPRLQG